VKEEEESMTRYAIERLMRAMPGLLLAAALTSANPGLAAPDDVERAQAAAKALEDQALPEKYKASQQIGLDFLKGTATNDGGKQIDVAITAASFGFPPAGIALGIIKAMFFDLKTTPDPVAEAINGLDRRLTTAEDAIRNLSDAVERLQDETLKIENRARLRELLDRRDLLAGLRNGLLERPQGQAARSLIDNALRAANRFLPDNEPDDDMWYWSDIRVYTDMPAGRLKASMLPKRFEPELMLESYLQSLALLVAAVDLGGYDPVAQVAVGAPHRLPHQ
jgi:hypothetical protein